jgi:lycopene cyclase domain-containing protein
VKSFTYLGVMLFVVVGSGWLELVMRTHVLRRWRRLLLSLLPVVVVFYLWDAYAISRGHWTFDPTLVTGVVLPGGVPLEELVFFVVVPLAAVLTLEAVRSARGWDVGDGVPPVDEEDGADRA